MRRASVMRPTASMTMGCTTTRNRQRSGAMRTTAKRNSVSCSRSKVRPTTSARTPWAAFAASGSPLTSWASGRIPPGGRVRASRPCSACRKLVSRPLPCASTSRSAAVSSGMSMQPSTSHQPAMLLRLSVASFCAAQSPTCIDVAIGVDKRLTFPEIRMPGWLRGAPAPAARANQGERRCTAGRAMPAAGCLAGGTCGAAHACPVGGRVLRRRGTHSWPGDGAPEHDCVGGRFRR